jgi:hypothetical protein
VAAVPTDLVPNLDRARNILAIDHPSSQVENLLDRS